MTAAREAVSKAETLRRVAEIRLRQEQANLARALEAIGVRTRAEAEAYARVISAKAFTPRTTEELSAHRATLLAAAAAHADCRRWTAQARTHADQVRADVVSAAAVLKSRERLKERRLAVLAEQRAAADQRTIDEAAASTHRRKAR